MKIIFAFILMISISYASQALGNIEITEKEGSSQSLKSSGVNNPKFSEEDDKKNIATSSEVEDEISDSQELESDSSLYSVNKFNILLYFVYKLKYGEDDDTEPVEE